QPTREQRLTQARKAHETAINTLQAVRQQAYRQSRQTEHDQLARHLQQQDKACADARALQARISTQRQQLQVLFVDTGLLRAYSKTTNEQRRTRHSFDAATAYVHDPSPRDRPTW